MKKKNKTKNKSNKKLMITSALLGSSIIMAGAGVGVGYIIWHNTPSVYPPVVEPIVTCKPSENTSTVFSEDYGHIAQFDFSLNKAIEYTTRIHIGIEVDYTDLMTEEGDGILQYCDKSGVPIVDPVKWVAGAASVDINPGSTKASICVKQNLPTPSYYDASTLVRFTLRFAYLAETEFGPETPIDNLNQECDIFLCNNVVPERVYPNNVINKYYKFLDIFSGVSSNTDLTIDDWISRISTLFPGLPSGGSINLAEKTTMVQVIQELQNFDNAESIACLLISDFVLSILRSNKEYAKHKANWGSIVVRIFNISLLEIPQYGSQTSYFDITFNVSGCDTDAYQEYDALFSASNSNFGSSDAEELWGMTWDYLEENGMMQRDAKGYARGLTLYPDYEADTSFPKNERLILQTIYGGVVSQWPEGWWTV